MHALFCTFFPVSAVQKLKKKLDKDGKYRKKSKMSKICDIYQANPVKKSNRLADLAMAVILWATCGLTRDIRENCDVRDVRLTACCCFCRNRCELVALTMAATCSGSPACCSTICIADVSRAPRDRFPHGPVRVLHRPAVAHLDFLDLTFNGVHAGDYYQFI